MPALLGTDPLLTKQWHLKATLGSDPNKILSEFDGTGIKIGIYDDGVEKTHADLVKNYDASLELTYGGVKADPSLTGGVHGTAVAGIIAGTANNGTGGSGIATGATITGVNIFSGAAYNNYIASIQAMSKFDVVNNSWGWTGAYQDNMSVAGSFGRQFVDALDYAAKTGRGGLGTIIVNSSGNDNKVDGRDANATEFNAARQTLTVGAIGQDGDAAAYTTRGASILVSAPSSGGGASITTTDKTSGGYSATDSTDTFGGTSAAAPIITAVAALMLDANPNLGWRDVQEILAYTADHTTPASLSGGISGRMEYGWTINGANNFNGGGLHYSNDVGFGLVDAFEAVRFAEVWSKFGAAATSANEAKTSVTGTVGRTIADNATTSFNVSVSQKLKIEHVDLTLTLTHPNVNELKIELVSPDGTTSIVLDTAQGTNAFNATTWTFGSEALRGELSDGTWTVRITDTKTGNVGSVASYKLDVYGEAPTANDVYHFTNEYAKMVALDASRGIITDTNGGTDWINAAGMIHDMVLDLAPGASSTMDGQAFVKIAAGTLIENAVTGDGNDHLYGNHLANELIGGRGDDYIEGRGGADVIDGGQGNDTAGYTQSGTGVDVDLTRATQLYGDAQGDRLTSIENVTGSAFDDVLRGDSGANVLTGGAGNDVLEGRGGADVLDGGAGMDTASYASSGAGVDVDLTRAVQRGGDAEGDRLISIERIEGSRFDDVLRGDAGDNVLRGGAGNDRLYGGDGRDVLEGGDGDDTLDGGAGADVLSGGAGTDTVEYLLSDAGVRVNLGARTATGGHATGDVLIDIENLTGSQFSDILTGDSGNNVLRGEGGNDTLYGMDGDDILVGGAGNDMLYGGKGKDVFLFDQRGFGVDQIGDFEKGIDKISFAGTGIHYEDLKITKAGAYSMITFDQAGGTVMVYSQAVLDKGDFLFA